MSFKNQSVCINIAKSLEQNGSFLVIFAAYRSFTAKGTLVADGTLYSDLQE
jgi:hypothetical protein